MKHTVFKVFFEDGHRLNIPAGSSDEARKIAKRKYDGIITKIKVNRQKETA